MNIQTIAEKIFQIEEEMDLFNIKIGGVHFWELIRFDVTGQIAHKLGIYAQAHTKSNYTSKYIAKYIYNAVKNIICRNPFIASKSDILFIGHPRRKLLEDGYWWDIYSDPIIENIKDKKKCLLLESPINNKHLIPARSNSIRYLDLVIFLKTILKKSNVTKVDLSNREISIVDELERQIQEKFSIDLDLKNIISNDLCERRCLIHFYNLILKKVKPKLVIILVSYGKETFVEACKKFDIPTVELQHGTISRYHTGYSFPGKKSHKKTFPGYFMAFGDYWKDLVDLPISDDKIYSVGYPFFEMQVAKYKNESKKNQIIFISQGTIGDRISKFAVDFKSKLNMNMNIIYKLHPGEYARWKKEYPWLVDSGIQVIDDESIPLYKLLAQSKFLVGVYSTTVYEGLGMGLRTFLLDLPGVEYMDKLVEDNVVSKVTSADELIQKLIQIPEEQVKANYIFKPNALENIDRAINEIMQHSQSQKTF